MKKLPFFLIIFALLYSCSSEKNTSKNNYNNLRNDIQAKSCYETLYEDSFDILIRSLGDSLTYVDTLYTEMYIALKSARPNDDGKCAEMVCEKVDMLLKHDKVKENQIMYLEAKQMAQGMLKDKDGFIKSSFQMYNLYPKNSIERLSSLGSLYLALNQKDSANYYLNKCLQVSKENILIGDNELYEKNLIGALHSLVLLGKDEEAKDLIKEQLKNKHSDYIDELLHSLDRDFENFKQSEWESVKNHFLQ